MTLLMRIQIHKPLGSNRTQMDCRIPKPPARYCDAPWHGGHQSPDEESQVQVRKREGGRAWLGTDLWSGVALSSPQIGIIPTTTRAWAIRPDPASKQLISKDRKKKKRLDSAGTDWGSAELFSIYWWDRKCPTNPQVIDVSLDQMWGQHTASRQPMNRSPQGLWGPKA